MSNGALNWMDFCLRDLSLSDGDSDKVTITRDQYQKLQRSRHSSSRVANKKMIADASQVLELDYEMPKSAFSFKIPKWSQIQQSIDILKLAAPGLLHPEFINSLYAKIFAKIPNAASWPSYENHQSDSDQSINQISSEQRPKINLSQALPDWDSWELEQPDYSQQDQIERPPLPSVNNQRNQVKEQTTIGIVGKNIVENFKEKVSQKASDQNVPQPTPADKELIKMGEIIISVFCCHGYNVKAFQQELIKNGFPAQPPNLNCLEVIRNILNSAYSKLQSFLKLECRLEISSLSLEVGESAVVNSLLNYKDRYHRDCSETLQHIIRGQCGLSFEPVTETKAVKLYEQIERDLMSLREKAEEIKKQPEGPTNLAQKQIPLQIPRQRYDILTERMPKHPRGYFRNDSEEPEKQINSIRKLNRVWNSRYETQLIHQYKIGKSIADITIFFQHKYPKDRDCFCPVALRSALYKICRQAVRKLQSIIEKFGEKKLPALLGAGHNEVRAMVYNNNGFNVRVLLLDVYLLTSYDEKIIVETIKEMNNYVEQMNISKLKADEMLQTEDDFIDDVYTRRRGRERGSQRDGRKVRRERPRRMVKEYKIDRSNRGYYMSY